MNPEEFIHKQPKHSPKDNTEAGKKIREYQIKNLEDFVDLVKENPEEEKQTDNTNEGDVKPSSPN